MLRLAKRGCVGALIALALALILSSPASAAVYKWSSFGAYTYATDEPGCVTVARESLRILSLLAGPAATYYWTGDCTGPSPIVVGSTISFGYGYYNAGWQTSAGSATLLSVIQDSTDDEVSAVSTQRVLVLVGSMICFFVGAVLGRA